MLTKKTSSGNTSNLQSYSYTLNFVKVTATDNDWLDTSHNIFIPNLVKTSLSKKPIRGASPGSTSSYC